MLAARRAAKLIEMVAQKEEVRDAMAKSNTPERPVVISLAVDQLAQAWGVRRA